MSPRVPPGTCGGSPRRRTAAQPARPTSAGGKPKDGVVRAAPRIVIASGGTAGGVGAPLARPAARPGREGRRYRVTGRPIPPPSGDRAAGRARFGVAEDETFVVVFGGSLGSRSINLAAIKAFADAPFRVLHITGHRDYSTFSVHDLRAGYELLAYLDLDSFGLALAAADLAGARSRGSVFELPAPGGPAGFG